MNWTKLTHPFHFISGERVAFLGLIGMLISSGFAYRINAHFNGTFNIKFVNESVPTYWCFIEPLINVILISLVFGAFGLIAKKQFRWIDLIGFNLAARIPMILLTSGMLIAGIDRASSEELLKAALNGNIDNSFTGFMIYSFASLPILVYAIYLIYHANATVLNLKKFKGAAQFILGLVITEIILYISYSQIYSLL
jgi:hypothetical protein